MLLIDYEEYLDINDKNTINLMRNLAKLVKEFTEYEGSVESLMKLINKANHYIYIIFNCFYSAKIIYNKVFLN